MEGTWIARHTTLVRVGTVAAVGVIATIVFGLNQLLPPGMPFGPRPGDPALVAGDSRLELCGIPANRTWIAFTMQESREVSMHFPGWSDGDPELLTDEPALVVMSTGQFVAHFSAPQLDESGATRPPERLAYDLCIAIGPPDGAIAHHYGPTRFDTVRPVLGGPLVTVP